MRLISTVLCVCKSALKLTVLLGLQQHCDDSSELDGCLKDKENDLLALDRPPCAWASRRTLRTQTARRVESLGVSADETVMSSVVGRARVRAEGDSLRRTEHL